MTAKDAARKYPIARIVPDFLVEKFLKTKKPIIMSEIKGITSLTGEKTEGWFIACPLTARQLNDKSLTDLANQRLLECAQLAAELGAQVVGLGAFTAVVGDGGITLSKHSPIPVTTGNSYTVATAIEGTMKAADLIGIIPSESTLAVVGATGSIGKTAAMLLSPQFARTLLVGRDQGRTQAVADQIPGSIATTDLNMLREADVVITVTSADAEIIEPKHLKTGSVVCDVARPRDVQAKVVKERPDVLVIEGGVVSVPGDVDFGMDFGFPEKTAYACMSETMMLALENRIEHYTLGKDVTVKQVEETRDWAAKHGFELAGFRSFEHALEQTAIDRVRKARQDQKERNPAGGTTAIQTP
ncbi:MAG: hypothetical protein KF784_07040 [Fimbriimonadaceae bacterium]|nr:hypothetical protein [Fimbriimonadaceae bacterium]